MNPLVKLSENLHFFFIRNTDFFCFSWDSILLVTQSLNELISNIYVSRILQDSVLLLQKDAERKCEEDKISTG